MFSPFVIFVFGYAAVNYSVPADMSRLRILYCGFPLHLNFTKTMPIMSIFSKITKFYYHSKSKVMPKEKDAQTSVRVFYPSGRLLIGFAATTNLTSSFEVQVERINI